MDTSKYPQYIEIQTTDSCNGKCSICPSQFVPRKGQMSDYLFKKIIDEISTYPNHPRIIPYLNGEPLLDDKIVERLKYIREKCLNNEIEVSTNLSNLKKEHMEAFREIKLDNLRISCFGFQKNTYESCMQGLDFNCFMKNIQELYLFHKEFNIAKLIEIVMIQYDNLCEEDIKTLKSYCEEHEFKFNLWGFLDRSQNVKGYSNNVNILPDHILRKCELNRLEERVYILSNGDMVPCCDDWYGKFVLGNICKSSILEIWENDYYKEIRAMSNGMIPNKIPELCAKCKLYKEYN